jgi:predicted acetyltransferase
MEIDIVKATRQDTAVLRQLYELYCHDFSEYTQADVDETGMYTDDAFLNDYWREPKWSAFLVRVDRKLAGFAWVLKTSLFTPDDVETQRLVQSGFREQDPHVLIEEFFIMRKYRRRGIGEYVAHHLFDCFPGVWEVSEMIENTPAQAFWRKVIDRYSNGNYVEVNLQTSMWHGPVQVFRSRE